MDASNGSLSKNTSNSGSEDSREAFQLEDYEGMIQPHAFEPIKETDSEADNMATDDKSSHSGYESVCSSLADINKDWQFYSTF